MPALKYPKIPGESSAQRRLRLYRIWVSENRDHVLNYLKNYHKKHYALNRIERNIQIKNYKQANKEKVKESQRIYDLRPEVIEKKKISTRRYHKNNPQIVRAQNVARKARLRGATSITSKASIVVRKWKSEPDFRCYYCGNKYPTLWNLHIDHLVPINKGGQHEADNLCKACFKCNCWKRDRLIEDLVFQGQQLLKF